MRRGIKRRYRMPAVNADTRDPALEAQVFWFRYRKEIALVVFLVLLALLSFAGWRLYRERREARSAAAFAEAKTAADYQKVIDEFGDTPAAAAASLLLADQQRKNGQL